VIRTFVQIAYRNVKKNRRRSLVTISAVAVGFMALSLFRGYTSNVYRALRWSAVTEEGLGHLTIHKKGFAEKGSLEPKKYMLSRVEIERIRTLALEEPGVVLVSPTLAASGLVSNGKVSHIFIAEGVVPDDFIRLRSAGHDDSFQAARVGIEPGHPTGVEMAEGLARVLDFKAGSGATLAGVTLDGQMNALDVDVLHTFNTRVPDTNDKYIRMPLGLVQSLYDTDGADRVLVLLDQFERTEPMRKRLSTKLAAAGIDTDIQTWDELSVFFSGTNEMLGMLLGFMGTIVLVIVVMSVINTMGIAVLERTREIGTLRVLGLKRRGTKLLFALEGCLLGLIGSVVGVLLHSAVWSAVKLARPTYTPPGFAEPVPFIIDYVPGFVLLLTVGMTLFALVAAITPAARAARQGITDSLGHV
jgi:putative ABC transport system permease protein